MYYPASDTIAAEHPDIAAEIRALDAYLRDNRGEALRASRIALHVDVEHRVLTEILAQLAAAGAVRVLTLHVCPKCDVVLEDDFECDICEQSYRGRSVPTEIGYEATDLGPPKDGTAPAEAAEKTRVLFIAGMRGGYMVNQIQTDKEYHAIGEALRGCQHRDQVFLLNPVLSATRPKLAQTYRDRPHVLHFAGHGDERVLALIEDQEVVAKATLLTNDQLIAILRAYEGRAMLCVLNACKSADMARAIVEAGVVDAAVGWESAVDDSAAIAFSRALYGALGDARSIEGAVVIGAQASGQADRPRLFASAEVAKQVIIRPSRGAQ